MSDESALTVLVHPYARLLHGGDVDAVVAPLERLITVDLSGVDLSGETSAGAPR